MSFLGGFFLLALPAIAIPAVIHLMRKRRRDVVHWGAMKFLRDPSHRGQQLSQIDRWLLLAARTLIVLCLIGALARPVLRWGTLADSVGLPVQLVMLDDTRSSLARQSDGNTTFDLIRASSLDLISNLPERTPLEVWAAGRPIRQIAGAGLSRSEMISRVKSFLPRGGDADFASAVRQVALTVSAASDIGSSDTASSLRSPMDVWLFCDHTNAGWKADSSPLAMVPGTEHRLHLMRLGDFPTVGYQVAVDQLRVSRSAIAMNEVVELSAMIANDGPQASPNLLFKWVHNDEVFAETQVPAINPGDRTAIHKELSIDQSGIHSVSLQLAGTDQQNSGDRLAADNAAHVVVQVIGELPLLVIDENQDDLDVSGRDPDYLAAALGRSIGEKARQKKSTGDRDSDDRWQSLFRPVVRSPRDLTDDVGSDFDWGTYPVIIWMGGVTLPDKVLRPMMQRVRQGAGLWITLDSSTDRFWLNANLEKAGLASNDVALVGEMVVNDSVDQIQRIHPPEPTDAILGLLSDTERLDLDIVRIRRRVRLQLPSDQSASRELLRTFDGDCVAWLSSLQRGRVVVQAFPMNPSWSNFPLTRSYVVWVLQILDHLSQPASESFDLAIGQMFRTPVASPDHRYQISLPDGAIQPLLALPSADGATVRFGETDRPGLYRIADLDDLDGQSLPFVVQGSSDESNLMTSNQTIWDTLAKDERIDQHSKGEFDFRVLVDLIAAKTDGALPGRPIWSALLLVLVIGLVLETFLAGYAAFRRYGSLQVESQT